MANTDHTSAPQQNSNTSSTQPTSSSAGVSARRYRKREDKRGSVQTGDSPSDSLQEESNLTESEIQRIKLNRLSNYEIDDVKMANVFGTQPDNKKPVSSSMRLNPLFDQDGTVEVSADQAQVAKITEPVVQETPIDKSGKASKKGVYKHPKQTAGEDDQYVDENGLPRNGMHEPKINYSKNFRFRKPSNDGEAGKEKGLKKLTTFGVVMPSRVKQNTIPKDQLVPAGGASQYALGAQDVTKKADIEAANSRHEIRRRWRYVIILILVILCFGLVLTVVLYFATRRA